MPPSSLSRLTLVNFSGVRSPYIRFRSDPVENPSCPRVFPFTHVLVTKTVCMKRFAAILSLAVLMGGCMKKDHPLLPKPIQECEVSTHTSLPLNGLSYGAGMVKTYDEQTGRVKTLHMAITQFMSQLDSLFYTFSYNPGPGNTVLVTIQGVKKHYLIPELGFPTPYPETIEPTNYYTFTATLDRSTQRLLKIEGTDYTDTSAYHGQQPETFILEYAGDRLVKFGWMSLLYDEFGNLSRVPSTGTGVGYRYDFRSKVKHQFFASTGYMVHEYYNLAEVCGWIPVSRVHLLSQHVIFSGYERWGELTYHSVRVDPKGYVLSYTLRDWEVTIHNTWRCESGNPVGR